MSKDQSKTRRSALGVQKLAGLKKALKFNRSQAGTPESENIYSEIRKFFSALVKTKVAKRVALAIGGVIVLIALVFTIFNLTNRNHVLPNTYIGKINFGGLTREEAKTKLLAEGTKVSDGSINFDWEEKTFSRYAKELNVDYTARADQTVDVLMGVGRKGSLGAVVGSQVKSALMKNQVKALFNFDENKLNDFLAAISKEIDRKEKDATVEIKDGKPVKTDEELGQKFPVQENKVIALDEMGNLAFSGRIPFTVQNIYPRITSAEAERAMGAAEIMLEKKLQMTARDKTFELMGKDIADLIEFRIIPENFKGSGTPPLVTPNASDKYSLVPEFSRAGVDAYITEIAAQVNQPAKDAKFRVVDSKVLVAQAAQIGYELEKDKALELVMASLSSNEETVKLPVKESDPSVTYSDPAQAGIVELVGEAETSWRGSPPNRIHNLELGAQKLSGIVVKPGEEFSTVKNLGPIDGEAGFKPELVIKNGNQVVPDFGGGLCQVSTTLFRSVLNAGLKITARTAHSFRVSYYEPPVGMDATIYDPSPDFKFINDMKTPILIWAFPGQNSLTFQIYGTKDGRQVSVSDPVVGDYTPPPDPVYTESSSMAAGDIRQVERATQGCTATFNYKVTASDGKVLENETFKSKYIPIADSFLYGPGTAGIPTPPPAQ